MTAHLILKRSGAITNESFPITGRVVVGRFDRDTGPVDVDLGHLAESSSVTRLHAELWCDASGYWYVKDLGSQNGTFVKRAADSKFQRADGERSIADGDELALGNVRFMFKIG